MLTGFTYRSNTDKRSDVQKLLENPETCSWSNREIARHCGVSHQFVNNLRKSINGNSCQSVLGLPRKSSGLQHEARVKEGIKVRNTIVLVICKNPGISITEIAQKIGRSPQAVSEHLKKIVASGEAHSVTQPGSKQRRYYPGRKNHEDYKLQA